MSIYQHVWQWSVSDGHACTQSRTLRHLRLQLSRHIFSETIFGIFSHSWVVTASKRNQMEAGISSLAFCVFLAAACFHRYGHDAKVVHFLGKVKPWNLAYDAQRGKVKGYSPSSDVYQLHPDYLLTWWQLYSKDVLPLLQRAYGDTPFNSGFVEESEEVSQGLARCVFKTYILSGSPQRVLSSLSAAPKEELRLLWVWQ